MFFEVYWRDTGKAGIIYLSTSPDVIQMSADSGHIPVSYTHLDVYKRQTVIRFLLTLCPGALFLFLDAKVFVGKHSKIHNPD